MYCAFSSLYWTFAPVTVLPHSSFRDPVSIRLVPLSYCAWSLGVMYVALRLAYTFTTRLSEVAFL